MLFTPVFFFFKIQVSSLVAHDTSIVSDLNFTVERWNSAPVGGAILICTDDVLDRLHIKDATTLIHYYIPRHSKFDFNLRLSLCIDRFQLKDAERPESYLLITREFDNALLTILRCMQRFGQDTSKLFSEAVRVFCEREFLEKKDYPLCVHLKVLLSDTC